MGLYTLPLLELMFQLIANQDWMWLSTNLVFVEKKKTEEKTIKNSTNFRIRYLQIKILLLIVFILGGKASVQVFINLLGENIQRKQ